jgi:hypothetical protein
MFVWYLFEGIVSGHLVEQWICVLLFTKIVSVFVWQSVKKWRTHGVRNILVAELLRIALPFQAVMLCTVIAYPVCHDVIRNAYQLANQLLYCIHAQVRHSIGYTSTCILADRFPFHAQIWSLEFAFSLRASHSLPRYYKCRFERICYLARYFI